MCPMFYTEWKNTQDIDFQDEYANCDAHWKMFREKNMGQFICEHMEIECMESSSVIQMTM